MKASWIEERGRVEQKDRGEQKRRVMRNRVEGEKKSIMKRR